MPWAFYELLAHRPIAAWQSGGVSRLLSVGDLLRLSGSRANIRRALSQSVLYGPPTSSHRVMPRTAASAAALCSVHEILNRSDLCPVAPEVDACIQSELADRFGVTLARLGPEETESLALRWCTNRRTPQSSAPLLRFDDEPDGAALERRIWDHLQTAADGQLRAWLHPQASIGALLGTHDDRRVDFVLCPPWTEPLVWEAHGILDPHDQLKSSELRRASWAVFDQIAGTTSRTAVENVIKRLLPEPGSLAIEPYEQFLVDAPWVASQVDQVLCWLLATGRWSTSSPRVQIQTLPHFVPVVDAAISSWFDLIRAVESVWNLAPADRLLADGMSAVTAREGTANVTVKLDSAAPAYVAAGDLQHEHTYEIRRACFPVDLNDSAILLPHGLDATVRPPAPPPEESLLVVMQRVFAKPSFRPGQAEAIQQAVTSNDALILFPTGYGKSLVFQMASLLLPGVTLVIEPFRALLDDQERNLQDNGVGRVASIHSGKPLHGSALQKKLSSACLVYVAAERMHVSEFISLIVEVVRLKGLDLFIVDEAHTVSQFGHSFRPAYLDLVERVTAICARAGRSRPTTLALTATAAQRVIHDIQALLQISSDPISLEEFASKSFVRENLEDAIVDVNIDPKDPPGESRDVADERRKATVREQLASILQNLPDGQGIVFCPTKRGFKPKSWLKRASSGNSQNRPQWIVGSPLFGARGIRDQIAMVRGPEEPIGLYTGGNDDDDHSTLAQMSKDASAFSQGRLAIMVATSAFGTGVDLQGVRWTLHVGMPGGLEAFYQESGRAGRDGSEARSVLLVDWDSDDLLDAMTIDASEEDPIAVLQGRLGDVQRRGSLARQLGLLIGDAPPTSAALDLRDPVLLLGDDGNVLKTKKGHPKEAFKPSFPGWRWEIKNVDEPLHRAVLTADRGRSIEFWCHTWWEDLVWKAIYRLAVLGVIRHGFEHSLRKADARTAFIVERCDDGTSLAPDVLAGHVEREVGRLTSIERARAARDVLHTHLATADPARRLMLSAAMLLKTVYRVVYETRIESLRSLVRYAREPVLQKRRDIIEDYFAPSDLKRQVFALCERRATVKVLSEALAIAEAQPRWRSAVFEVAASEYPGSVVPLLLLAVGGVKIGDPKESARYLFALLSNESVSLEVRSWCYGQVSTLARQIGILAPMLDAVAGLMRDAPSLSTLEALVAQMEDDDGCTEFGHLLVAAFFSKALESRS